MRRAAAIVLVGSIGGVSAGVGMLLVSCIGDDPGARPVATDDGGGNGGDTSTTSDGGGGNGDTGSGFCEDVTFCDDKCGAALPDKCGIVRDCSTPCGDGRKCDGVRCVCATSLTWCEGRCGSVKDNCGKDLPCSSACDGGVACDTKTGTCGGCVPDEKSTTCKDKQCGFAINNCGQQVDCSGGCPSNTCNNNICCASNSQTCAGKCGPVQNNCGLQVPCSACCPDGLPVNAPSNCGGCAHNCTGAGFTCASNTCFCPNTNNNSDPYDCGHCSADQSGQLRCLERGFKQGCVNGACK